MNEAEAFAEFVEHRNAIMLLAPFWGDRYTVTLKKMAITKMVNETAHRFYCQIKGKHGDSNISWEAYGWGDTVAQAVGIAVDKAKHEVLTGLKRLKEMGVEG